MSNSNRQVLFVSTGVDNNVPPVVIATADNKNALVSPDAAAVDDLAAATQQISLEEHAQARKLHQAELDSLFETSLGAQLKGLKKTPMPKLLQVELYPYQQTGVRWLAARENDTESVPVFWKERMYGSVRKWWHSLVDRAFDEKPSPNCGSILADGMLLLLLLLLRTVVVRCLSNQALTQLYCRLLLFLIQRWASARLSNPLV